jgi:protein-S-isoprenylcysteine O-methyltransferase Ste14
LFSGLMFGLLPAVILHLTRGDFGSLQPPLSAGRWLALQALALFAIIGISAVQEFAERGEGTPVPFDPPTRLVTSGVYAYVSNPMQISMTLLLLGWGAYLGSFWVAAAGAMAVIYSLGLAHWGEGGEMPARFGAAWQIYRRSVRSWRPRRRPWDPSGATGRQPARLYVAESCVPCSRVGQWIAARRPVGLELVAAEDHPSRDLHRITYDPGDASGEVEGVAAFGRALEHIHLGWAYLGWAIRLPLLRELTQMFVDALGGGPRLIPRRRT